MAGQQWVLHTHRHKPHKLRFVQISDAPVPNPDTSQISCVEGSGSRHLRLCMEQKKQASLPPKKTKEIKKV